MENLATNDHLCSKVEGEDAVLMYSLLGCIGR